MGLGQDAAPCPSPGNTAKERDQESGNDYFGARYYASSMGRFMSPDPLPWIHWQNGNRDAQQKFAAYIANPQNFNMYAYVNNNPLNKTDPTGMNACGTNNDSTCHVTITIKDRSRDANGKYNDQFAGLKGQAGYNATATVTVTGTGADGKAFSASGTFLAKTTPDDSNKSGTIQVGIYDATSTMHRGQYSAILLGTVPTIGPNPRQGGEDFATSIEMHKSGTGGAAVAISDPSHPVSEGCLTVYRDQYANFQNVTGLEPTAGTRQGQFTVDVNTQANQLNISQ
jgi:RHS repeat-associated protein